MIVDDDATPTNSEAMTTSQDWISMYGASAGSVLLSEYDFNRQDNIDLYVGVGQYELGFEEVTAASWAQNVTNTWNFGLYIRPDTLDDETTNDGYSDAYLNPDDLSDNIAAGTTGWFDSDENTASSTDFFNEDEGVYSLQGTMNSTTFAEFDIDGGTYTRYKPFFKIRGWRSVSEPSSVTLEGAGLSDGTNYNLDIAPFSEAWTYDSGGTWAKLADGGDLADADEYLADSTNDWNFDQAGYDIFDNAGDYFYLASHDQFTGVNLNLSTVGSGSSPVLTWQYCSVNSDTATACDTWSTLSVTDTDSGASNMTASGNFYFADPAGWVASTENSGRQALWHIRAYISSGSYSTFPVEDTVRTDILLLQYLSDISSNDQTFIVVPESLWVFLGLIPFIPGLIKRRQRKN
ncbi:hypothetical protein KKB80_12010, partial [bacterium]|nr:hypothetical protein [bacterium]